jgi:hypothetical protein
MSGVVDPKDGKLRIYKIVILDVVVISFLTWLVLSHVASLILVAIIGYPTLLVTNVIVIWRASQRRVSLPGKTSYMSKLALFALGLYTIGSVVETYYWVKEPNLITTIKALLGILFAGYGWFLVRYFSRRNKDQVGQK